MLTHADTHARAHTHTHTHTHARTNKRSNSIADSRKKGLETYSPLGPFWKRSSFYLPFDMIACIDYMLPKKTPYPAGIVIFYGEQ